MMGGRTATFFCSSVRPDMKRPCERLKIYLKYYKEEGFLAKDVTARQYPPSLGRVERFIV
jgi:hypothetical protein